MINSQNHRSQQKLPNLGRHKHSIVRRPSSRDALLVHVLVKDLLLIPRLHNLRHDKVVKLGVRLEGNDAAWLVEALDLASRAAT